MTLAAKQGAPIDFDAIIARFYERAPLQHDGNPRVRCAEA